MKSFNTAKLHKQIQTWNLKKLTIIFVVFGLVIGLISLNLWYSRVFITPEKRFWSALENSMSTPSVVRTLEQGGSGNRVVQDYRFHFSPQEVIENKVTFNDVSATSETFIETEGIVYPGEQYLRYTQFQNEVRGEGSSNIDDLVGVWAFQEGQGLGEDPEQSRITYLSEYVTLVIFGNFSASYRNDVIQQLQDANAYGPNLNSPLEEDLNGEDVYVYAIEVNLPLYAQLLNESFVAAGYGDFPPLNPENYREGSTVSGQVVVNKKSGSVVGINFGDRAEAYSNYGVIKEITPPEATITIEELQQQVQQQLSPEAVSENS